MLLYIPYYFVSDLDFYTVSETLGRGWRYYRMFLTVTSWGLGILTVVQIDQLWRRFDRVKLLSAGSGGEVDADQVLD